MAALAEVHDVEAGWRPHSQPETTVAVTLLDRASAIIRNHVAGVDARVAADANFATLARGVAADMVKRVLVNPEAVKSFTIDDYTRVRDQAVSSGWLYLSDMEQAQLTANPAVRLNGAYVVSLGG